MGVLDQVYIVIPPYAPNYGRVIGGIGLGNEVWYLGSRLSALGRAG